jgi:lysophospholipid acyltransferase (LPLAT)-like uncharacterized protein
VKRLLDPVIPGLAAVLIRGLRGTLRIRHTGSEGVERLRSEGRRFILAFWHAHLLMMVYARYPVPVVAMISRHRDGELIARTVEKFGARAARGSTTRGGGAALREMIRDARGSTLAITPDGPKGPRQVAQRGVVQVAQVTGNPIIPIAFIAQKKNSSARGTVSRFRGRSAARSFSTAKRSTCRGNYRNPSSSTIGARSKALSMTSRSGARPSSNVSGSRG